MRHTAVCNLNHNDFDFDDGVATIDLDSPPTPWPVPDQLGTLSSLHAAPCRRSTPAGGMRSDDVFKAAAFAGVANALAPAPVSLQYSDWYVVFSSGFKESP